MSYLRVFIIVLRIFSCEIFWDSFSYGPISYWFFKKPSNISFKTILAKHLIVWIRTWSYISINKYLKFKSCSYMSNWISSGMGMGTGGIPTADNIPETTEKLGCPTDNTPDNRFFKTLNFIIFIWNKIN